MEEYYQPMDWPLDPDWKCPICGNRALLWGFMHGRCRCDCCHTVFNMRDWDAEGHPPVTTPIWLIKPEYKEPAISAWAKLHKPLDELSDAEWEEAGAPPIVEEAT